MSNPREIAEKIIKKDLVLDNVHSDYIILARAYLELEKENENLKRIIAKELNENDEFGAELVFVNILKQENEKLKKSREALGKAIEIISRGESQFDNVDHMYTAREAIKQDDEIMGEK